MLLGGIAAGAIVAYVSVHAAEQRAQRALVQMQEKEVQRLAAERDATAAVAGKVQAETDAASKAVELGDTREQLAEKNAGLQKAVKEITDARERADRDKAAAIAAAADLKRARDQLQEVNAAQQAEIKKLNAEKKKLSSTLKE